MTAPAVDRQQRYADAAIESELSELANTQANRNDALNKAAFALGGFVAAGALGEDEAVAQLEAACEANGYLRKDGRAQVRSTIKSGLRRGMQRPRDLPADDSWRTAAPSAPRQPDAARRQTLDEVAGERKLPIDALQHMGWEQTSRGIEIHNKRRDGSEGRIQIRSPKWTSDRFAWDPKGKGVPEVAYEPDLTLASNPDLYICEGASDAATMAYAGFRALGVAGSHMVRTIENDQVDGAQRAIVCIDAPNKPGDNSGQTFAAGVRKRLAELGFKGPIVDLRMPEGAKDPSELWVQCGGARLAFAPEIKAALCTHDRAEALLAELQAPDPTGVSSPAELPRPKYLTLAEMAAECLRPVGQRLTTGFETLDQATRGGIPLGRMLALLGAPGAGKSTLAVQLADACEQQGCAVVYLAADEPAEGIITRLGQLAGFSREALESDGQAGDSIRAAFAERARGRAVAVIDPDADDSMRTIEDAAQALDHLAGDKPRVLIVDSLQTAQCTAAEGADSARERIDAKLGVLKAVAKRGVLVVAISEMARSGYRSGDRNQDTSALAAGKESGAIEYGAALLLGLRSVKGEHGQVDVEVAKNRLGSAKPDFRLQLDPERACFAEIPVPEPGSEEAERAKQQINLAKVEADARELLRLVLKQPGMGERDLRTAVKAQGLVWGVERVNAAKHVLERGLDGYQLVDQGNAAGKKWIAVPQAR